jgi:hypothetical protein
VPPQYNQVPQYNTPHTDNQGNKEDSEEEDMEEEDLEEVEDQ